MKIKIRKYGKMISIFEFSISKLGDIDLFIKIWGKVFFLKLLPAKDILGQKCQKS